MREFFKGWRRKAGRVTLVMACAFAAGWVRSFSLEDRWYVILSGKSIHRVVSSPEGIAWELWGYPFQIFRPETIDQPGPRWKSKAISPFGAFYQVDVIRDLKWCGFRYRDGELISSHFPSQLLIAPYWSLVIPLTVASAWLLLSKPRQATTPEPTPTTDPDNA